MQRRKGETKMIKCERCFDVSPKGYQIIFMAREAKEDFPKSLCKDCYEIVKHAASPESWQDTTKVVQRYYFDKH